MKIGFVGCGAISGIYLQNITKVFKEIEIAGVCDLVRQRAEDAAAAYSLPRVYKDMHELFADPAVDIVLNLTRPYEHYEVTKAALLAGKHVYSEKPLGATLEEGKALFQLAKEKGRSIGGAPDTFLGAGIQTCRKLLDAGLIGEPVGASAFMVGRGHETWHPDPEFYYKHGGGPMFDMGPYYLTALVNLLGSVSAVSGMARASFPTRLITSQPHQGQVITVDVPTYITGLMRFASGVIGTIFTTFDAHVAEVPRIEIYGSEGTLSVPDPNTFGGDVRIFRKEEGAFLKIPLMFGYGENSRALGLADLAKAIQTQRPARASGELTFHVLEIMSGFLKSAETRAEVAITSAPPRPAVMGSGGVVGVLE
jgi:predicted dehydrogenase